MALPEEIELKLEVPPDRVDSLYRLPHLKGMKPNKSKTLLSVYFDTDKQKLRKDGLSLRVRRINGHFLQTIKKLDSRSVGLFERNEWERERTPNAHPHPTLGTVISLFKAPGDLIATAPPLESIHSQPPFWMRGCTLCISRETSQTCLCDLCQD
jgi:hypothetical protein